MMIGRCSKGQHHIAGEDEHRTNERTKRRRASLRWEKSVGVGLNERCFGPHERKVFIFVEAKERRDGKIFPLGKRGDYKEISLEYETTMDAQ